MSGTGDGDRSGKCSDAQGGHGADECDVPTERPSASAPATGVWDWKPHVSDNEGNETWSSFQQTDCEMQCALFFSGPDSFPFDDGTPLPMFTDDGVPLLAREHHIAFLRKGLKGLSAGYAGLDASRPWLVYWIVHSLDLLGEPPIDIASDIVDFLRRCLNPDGGFGGGPGQISHLAPTYAAVLSLLVLSTDEALDLIDREGLYRFYSSLKDPASGGFCMHQDGEIDARGTYTAIAIADLVNILTPQLTEGVAGFLARCQTAEGGFGGEPGNEAHGGNAFCAVAALAILDRLGDADVDALTKWLVDRQLKLEGGFQGRTNKLVDGCYSFWQGGTFMVVADALGAAPRLRPLHEWKPLGGPDVPDAAVSAPADGDGGAAGGLGGAGGARAAAPATPAAAVGHVTVERLDDDDDDDAADGAGGGVGCDPVPSPALFDPIRLQRYILLCCQQREGGLRDKPGKGRDYYHTCYCLSGLSVAQHSYPGARLSIFGDESNLVHRVSHRHNIRVERVAAARARFGVLECSQAALAGHDSDLD